MITTEIYNGQGPGDQLWVYLTTRYIAYKNGYDFGIGHSERWKLKNLNIDFGLPVIGGSNVREGGPYISLPDGISKYYKEKHTWNTNFHDCNISDIDWDAFKVEDFTKLEGLFHYSFLIKENFELFKNWLDFESVINRNPVVPGKVIANIRGGEYRDIPDLILPKKYWDLALERLGNPSVEIVTDDPAYALTLIPDAKIFEGNMINHFERLFTADKLILSNSAFGFFPAVLGNSSEVIAPKYWSRWNVSDGFWCMECDRYEGFTYIDRDGKE
jgi:hypothetical protein